MRLKSQDEILDMGVRKIIIEEIEMPENKRRKEEAYRRYQMYKDHTDRFVVDMLLRQFDSSTVGEMSYALSNVSLVRKVIDKLSRVYTHGVDRKVVINDEDNDEATETLEELETYLEFDSRMKQTNRLLKLHRNVAHYVKPCPFVDDDGNIKNRVRLSPLSPYLYDVVEEFYDRTRPLIYVLSNFEQNNLYSSVIDPGTHQNLKHNPILNQTSAGSSSQSGNRIDESIADKKEDEDAEKKHYIFWCNKYHFTTDETGAIINEEGNVLQTPTDDDVANPIEVKPFVNFAIDQEGSFWAEGGDDLISGGINVNSMITNTNHIGVTQGYGQFYMTGKNLPSNVKIGPSKFIKLEQEEGEPTPTIGFASANPPLADLRAQIEQSIALLLTTNNLSTTGVAAQLSAGGGFASGIALMIDKAESQEDVQDQRQIFIDKEEDIWKIVAKWIGVFKLDGSLDPELEELALQDDFGISLEFVEPPAIASEGEKLDNIQKRKDLGLNSMEELIRKDQPGLTDAQIDEKLKNIEEEKKERMASFAPGTIPGGDNKPGGEEDDDNLSLFPKEDDAKDDEDDSDS